MTNLNFYLTLKFFKLSKNSSKFLALKHNDILQKIFSKVNFFRKIFPPGPGLFEAIICLDKLHSCNVFFGPGLGLGYEFEQKSDL